MKIISSWDDGGIKDMRIADLMSKHGIETTFYIPVLWQRVNTLKRRYSIDLNELRKISKDHHIGAHTITHPHLTSLSPDDAWTEIFDSKKMLEELVGKAVTSFCYPRGYFNESIKEMVRISGYEDARTTKVGYLYSEDPYETHTALHVGYPRKEYGDKHWTLWGQELFMKAQADPDAVFHFWGHSEEVDRLDEWENLEMFLEKITT
jgi:peptidoglycan/xylan/chitin deacetylase (PgdA/CDA1 family)